MSKNYNLECLKALLAFQELQVRDPAILKDELRSDAWTCLIKPALKSVFLNSGVAHYWLLAWRWYSFYANYKLIKLDISLFLVLVEQDSSWRLSNVGLLGFTGHLNLNCQDPHRLSCLRLADNSSPYCRSSYCATQIYHGSCFVADPDVFASNELVHYLGVLLEWVWNLISTFNYFWICSMSALLILNLPGN